MSIPKEINPDFLKDTIVEIRYNSELPNEVIVGLSYKKLLAIGYKYVQIPKPGLPPPSVISKNYIDVPLEHHFTKSNIRVTFRPGSIVFNHYEKYPLWPTFFSFIQEAVENLVSENLFSTIQRIGLRYINTFENTNIFDIIKPNWHITLDKFSTNSSSIKTELVHSNYRVILNVGNNYLINNKKLSLIDIDVINNINSDIKKEKIFEIINAAHKIEKEIMFISILKKEYLEGKEVKY